MMISLLKSYVLSFCMCQGLKIISKNMYLQYQQRNDFHMFNKYEVRLVKLVTYVLQLCYAVSSLRKKC